MTTIPNHVKWLKDQDNSLRTATNRPVKVFDLLPNYIDNATFSAWAKHFRQHYCKDHEIDILRSGTSYTRAEYLINLKFPESSAGLGPSIRSGDFAEILIADFIEYILNHWVPRTRYADKTVRNESAKGTDVIGFKIIDPNKNSVDDILSMYEVKAQLTPSASSVKLQDAIDDSAKDELRLAESLNAIKQRLLLNRQTADIGKVARYQNISDRPYTLKYGAVAVIDSKVLAPTIITEVTTAHHPDGENISLILIVIDDAMKLVHHLYEIAANEA